MQKDNTENNRSKASRDTTCPFLLGWLKRVIFFFFFFFLLFSFSLNSAGSTLSTKLTRGMVARAGERGSRAQIRYCTHSLCACTQATFTCQNQPLEQVESFKYLGLPFHQSGHISHLITPKLNKAAASWAIVQQKHAQLPCSDTVCLKFRLFQSILCPAFHYGGPVWGMRTPTDSAANNIRKQLEQKHMLYLERLYGVPSTTSHAVILAELNMHSLKHFWWQQTIAFWNALASAPASCLHRLVLIDNLQDAPLHSVHNSSWSVSHCRSSVGYDLPTQVQSIPVIDTNTVIAGLEHQASLSWSNLSSSPRTAPTRNAKLCTWHNRFRPFNISNPYFLLPVSGKRMKHFLRFRLSCLSLPIETGRHHRPPSPRSSRFCPHCPLASVGDEYHLVFECPNFQPLRDKYHTLFSSRTSSMRAFFAQKERMLVYKFISDCLDMINS